MVESKDIIPTNLDEDFIEVLKAFRQEEAEKQRQGKEFQKLIQLKKLIGEEE
tara:strand:+ start:508 stop:663 length:156 start_codon:yes stop_codon:yes gene_type:complete